MVYIYLVHIVTDLLTQNRYMRTSQFSQSGIICRTFYMKMFMFTYLYRYGSNLDFHFSHDFLRSWLLLYLQPLIRASIILAFIILYRFQKFRILKSVSHCLMELLNVAFQGQPFWIILRFWICAKIKQTVYSLTMTFVLHARLRHSSVMYWISCE